jgi:GR25 family glycosyltransferase involved in LPS biosynthesis
MELILENYSPKVTQIKNGSITDNVLNLYSIYVINLEEDIYRKTYIKFLLKKEKINYFLIEVKRMNNEDINISKIKIREITTLGCAVSHLWCISNAIEKKFERFIVFEDDIVFHKNYKTKIEHYLNLNFDLLMLGACDFRLKENIVLSNITNKPHKDILYYPSKNALGGHANLYSLNFAKDFFAYKMTNKFKEFDTEYDIFYPKYNIAICLPNLIITELTTTNNYHHYSPLNGNSNSYKRYVSNCYPESFSLLDYKYITIDFIKFASTNKSFINYKDLVEKYCDKNKTCCISDLKTILLDNTYSLKDVMNINNLFKN